ncbi:hypothetical protein [uncultured Tistrella sp.]|uniref:hypothetical protein n=1 Tax=Tistrella mobilis TaxID=171437 RepID=UPI000C0B06CE|nr:hypothetical protein [uncultured Tistrella sp.]MAM76489.1 hypothetical protein [Tistrella sp.]
MHPAAPVVPDLSVLQPLPPQTRLEGLRAEIAAARIVDCGMVHERVLRAADGQTPLPSDMPNGVVRAGLCPMPVRRQRLACSHTAARVRMIEAVGLLQDAEDPAVAALQNRIGELDARIGRIDHARGDAELAHALACRDGDAAARDDAAAQIAETGRQFTRALADLDALRSDLLAAMDRQLAKTRAAGGISPAG